MENLTHDRQVLGRVSDRLRSMAEAALVRRREELEGESLAGAVHELCAWAAHRQGIDQPIPVLNPLASGDVLEVVGRDFLGWVESSGDPAAVQAWRRQVERLRQVA